MAAMTSFHAEKCCKCNLSVHTQRLPSAYAAASISSWPYLLRFMRMCCSDEEKGRLEELILACIRCGEWRVLEVILGKILERQKLINWKVTIILLVTGSLFYYRLVTSSISHLDLKKHACSTTLSPKHELWLFTTVNNSPKVIDKKPSCCCWDIADRTALEILIG